MLFSVLYAWLCEFIRVNDGYKTLVLLLRIMLRKHCSIDTHTHTYTQIHLEIEISVRLIPSIYFPFNIMRFIASTHSHTPRTFTNAIDGFLFGLTNGDSNKIYRLVASAIVTRHFHQCKIISMRCCLALCRRKRN